MLRTVRMIAALAFVLTMHAGTTSVAATGTTWVEESPARRAMLVELLRRADYDRLESELTDYQSRHEAGQLPEGAATNDYFAFQNSDAALEPSLLAWQSAMPQSYAAPLATGLYYIHLGWLSRGTKYVSETAPAQLLRMRRYFNEGQTHLLRALQINDRLVLAYARIAASYMAMGNSAKMHRFLRDGLAKVPSSWTMHQAFLGTLEPRWGGSIADVRSYFLENRERLEVDPGLRPLLGYFESERAAKLWRQQDLTGAVEAYSAALAYGETGQVLHSRGKVLYRLGRLDEAMADQKRAACRMASAADAYASMAYIRSRARDYSGAMTYWDEAVKLDPRNPEILMGRADHVLFDTRRAPSQRKVDALADLDAALEFGSYDLELFSQRRSLFLSWGRFSDALTEAEHGMRLSPEDSRAWMGYAEALVFAQDCRAFAAYATFQKVCESQGTCAQVDGKIFPGLMRWMRCGSVDGPLVPERQH